MIASSEAYSPLRNVASRMRLGRPSEISNSASTVFVPPMSPASIVIASAAGSALAGVRGQKDEEIRLGRREIYVHYGDGMGQSKLVIPAAKTGTARNLNTVATLAKMAAEL